LVESREAITPRPSLLDLDVRVLESMPLLLGDTSPSKRGVKVSPHHAPSLYST